MSFSLGIGLGLSSGQPVFTPAAFFLAGEPAGWWDPSDFSTMFQDSAGTTPVTAVGQPVGLIRDKSGRGNHLTQPTAASRPTLQQDASSYFYLLFDGVDDWMFTAANFDPSTTDKLLVVAGVRKLSDAARALVAKLSTGTFQIEAPPTLATATFSARSAGTLTSVVNSAAIYPAPFSAVITDQGEISTDTLKLRVNQTEYTAAADQGTGNYLAGILWVGADSTGTINFFNGRLYSLIIRGTLSSAAQVVQAERYVGSKMGIAL